MADGFSVVAPELAANNGRVKYLCRGWDGGVVGAGRWTCGLGLRLEAIICLPFDSDFNDY